MPVVQDEISLVKVADGRGILGTPVSTYAQSTSGTTPPTTWSATRPNVPAGQYLWTRVVTTYTDNTTSETQTPTLMGKPGESGLGIKEKSINYAAGTSGNTPPTTGWQETIPTVSANQYLWTRTTLVYTDDSKTDAYSVGKMGANGADAQLLYLTASAENMAFNADDTPKTTQTINISAKLQNVTGTATFTAIPYIGNTAQPAITLGGSGNTRTLTSAQWTNKNWTLIAITATLGNLNDTLSIVKVKDGAKGDQGATGPKGDQGNQGIQGPTGADGKPSYTHWAYAWSADGTDRFTTSYPGENLVLNYDFSKDPTMNGWTGNGATIEYSNGNMRVLFDDSSTNRRVYYMTDELATLLPTGVKYSVTIDAFSNNGGSIRVGNFDTLSAWAPIQASTTKTYKFEGLTSGVNSAFSIQGDSSTLIVRILKIKIELGNTATPYTPSPSEDFANAYPTYAGSYVDSIATDSEDPTKYTWQRILGDDGKDGEKGDKGDTGSKGDKGDTGSKGDNGVSATGTQVQYVQSSSMTEPTAGWSATRPTPVPGQWLWTRSRSIFSNGTYGAWATVPTLIGREAIVISTTAPSNPSTGTLWQTPTDPNVKKWDGTKWVDWGISVDNLVAENIVIKDGKFETLEGVTIKAGTVDGGKFTSSFQRDVWIGSAQAKKGAIQIEGGYIDLTYDLIQKSNSTVLSKGGYNLDENGLIIFTNDVEGGILKNTQYADDGIYMTDVNLRQYGTGKLSFQDLVKKDATGCSPASGYSQYSTSTTSANYPSATRIGRIVNLSGAFTNNGSVTSSATEIIMGYVPEFARPAIDQRFVVQGSSMNRFLLVITATGKIMHARYGTSAYATIPAGAWLNIACVYAAADM